MKLNISLSDGNLVCNSPWIPYEDKYYGVKIAPHGDDDTRGFITKSDFYGAEWVLRSTDMLTSGNGWEHRSQVGTLTDMVTQLLKRGDIVVQFDSFSELAQWLDEAKND